MTVPVRAAAARCLRGVMDGKSLNQLLPEQLTRVADRDQALLQQLCYGTLREYPRLDALLSQLLSKPLRKKDNDVRALLLLGLYQLDQMRTPDHAAVSATVDAIKALKKPWARSLTNAVLRRYQREHAALNAALPPAATASHPQWLYDEIRRLWPERAEQVFKANNNPPPMSLRVNARCMSRDAYLEKLHADNIDANASNTAPQGIRLVKAMDVAQLPGFAEGKASVQDEAAQLAAVLLDPQPGDRILDACAAPGGKACHLLELQPDIDELVAADIDQERLNKVEENLARLQLKARTQVADAAQGDVPGTFDRILVDAPCSATGVIRRHPDVKILRRQDDIAQLAKLQLEILQGLWPALKPGGTLLYATCSILSQENSEVVQRFLSLTTDAHYSVPEGTWGIPCEYGRQLLPDADGPDGLFYALLHKSTA